MAKNSGIEWCHHTFNPWWGCAKVSPGCDNCYAERDAARWHLQNGGHLWGTDAHRREFGDKHWNEPVRWNAAAHAAGERHRVFCASMADVFDKNAPAAARRRLWELIAATPHLDWLILTKRIGNAMRMLPVDWLIPKTRPKNVRIGISVVNQEEADRDIPKLLELGGPNFVSVEPMLELIDLPGLLYYGTERSGGVVPLRSKGYPQIDWVICGGESGPLARPMKAEWARTLRVQCAVAGVPFFFKQWGEWLTFGAHSMCLRTDGFGSYFARVDGIEYRGDKIRYFTPDGSYDPDADWAVRVGRDCAGRMLDGCEWNQFPEPSQ